MELEIRTSPTTGATLNIHFLPVTKTFEDRTSECQVKVYSSNGDRSILHEMPWHFSYEVGQKHFTVMFYPERTKVTTETMLDVLRGYFGGISYGYGIELDPVSYNNIDSYIPDVVVPSTIFFDVQWSKDNYPND